jgi:hypothetical protein
MRLHIIIVKFDSTAQLNACWSGAEQYFLVDSPAGVEISEYFVLPTDSSHATSVTSFL